MAEQPVSTGSLLSLPDDILALVLLRTLPPRPDPCPPAAWAPAQVHPRLRAALARVWHGVSVGSHAVRAPHLEAPASARRLTRARAALAGGLRDCALRRLAIGFCDGIGDEDVVGFCEAAAARGGRGVECLSLKGCDHVSNASAEALARKMCSPHDFRDLELVCHPMRDDVLDGSGGVAYGMTDHALSVFSSECPNIEFLRLWLVAPGQGGEVVCP